jgi:hypothetical protein
MLYRKAKNCREDVRLVLSTGMIGIQAVAGELLSLDDRLASESVRCGLRRGFDGDDEVVAVWGDDLQACAPMQY